MRQCVRATIPFRDTPIGVAIDPRLRRVMISLYDSELRTARLLILDATTGAVLHTIQGMASAALAIDTRAGRIVAVDAVLGSSGGPVYVSTVMTRSGKVLRTIVVTDAPNRGEAIAAAVDEAHGRAVVVTAAPVVSGASGYGRDVASIIDTHTGHLLKNVTLGIGPPLVGVSASTGRIFVANGGDNTMSVLDAAHARTNSSGPFVGRVVRVGIDPFALAVDAQTHRVFVVNNGSSNGRHAYQGSVSVLDAATGSLRATIPLGFLTQAGGSGTPLTPQSIAVDGRSGRVFVVSAGALDATTGAPRGRGWVTVLDGATGRVLNRSTVGVAPAAIAVDAVRGRVFVVNNGDATMSVLDGATGRVLRTVTVGTPYPQAVALDTRAGHVFVASEGGNAPGADRLASASVTLFDARTGARQRSVAVEAGPPTVVVDEKRGRVVIGASPDRYDSYVDTLDAATGLVLHRVTLPGPPAYPLVVDTARGRAVLYEEPNYMGGASYVDVLDTRGGRILRTVQVSLRGNGSPLATAAMNAVTGHALIATQDDPEVRAHISVVDTPTGRVIRTMMIGRGVPTVVVDAHTRRVFVTNRDDNTVTVLDATRL